MGELAFVAALQLLDMLVYQGPAIDVDDGLSERCVVEKFQIVGKLAQRCSSVKSISDDFITILFDLSQNSTMTQ